MSTLTTPQSSATSRGTATAITLLAVLTGLVHLYLGIAMTAMLNHPDQVAATGGAVAVTVFAVLFYVSFVGYLALAVALRRPSLRRYRRLIRWGLVAWAAGNLVAYFVLAIGHYDAFGMADKLIEVALIALLVVEDRRERRLVDPATVTSSTRGPDAVG